MDPEIRHRLLIALGISVGAHLLFGIIAEAGSSSDSKPEAKAPVVEISRIAVDGSTMPVGPGDSSFNSRPQAAQPDQGNNYGLDAGMPVRLNVPKPSGAPPQIPATTPVPPVQGQTPTQPTTQFTPPTTSNQTPQNTPAATVPPPSSPSQAATQGNQGQKRSRGPNRAAFPIETIEPQVPASMVGGGVTNSVDVSVEIAIDGTHTERIVRTSGSQDVDGLVLEALKKWKWDPAAAEGQPISSIQNFKFTFKPR